MEINSVNSMSYGTAPKKNSAKKTAYTLLTAAAVTGGILYAAKTGKLNQKEGGNIIIEKTKAGLKNSADFIFNASGKVKEAFVSFADKHPKAGNVFNKISEAATAVVDKVLYVKRDLSGRMCAVADYIESKFHPEKFQ